MHRDRFLLIILMAALICFSAAAPAVAHEQQVCLVINGEIMHMNDEPPYYYPDGQIIVPVRYIAERIGGACEWSGSEQKAIVVFPGRKIMIQLGNPDIVVDGNVVSVAIAPHEIYERLMVPLSFMESYFPAHFDWDPNLSVLSIDTK